MVRIAIPDDQPEAITVAMIDIQTGNTNHKVAERLLSVLSLESVRHMP